MGDQHEDVKYKLVAGGESLHVEDVSQKVTMIEMQNNDKIIGGVNLKNGSSERESGASRKYLYIAASIVNLTAFACGNALGWTSPVLPKLNGEIKPVDTPLPRLLTTEEESWIGSMLPLGAAFGPIAAGLFVDKIGRKKTLLVSVVPMIISFFILAFAQSVSLYYLARFLCGLGIGGIFTALPMYIGEVAEDEIRGALSSFLQLFITFGLLFSYCIGPYVSLPAFNLICVVALVLFMPLCIFYVPESPYYLVAVGQQERSEDSLMKLRSKSNTSIQKELDGIKTAVNETITNRASFLDIFKSRGLTKALIISIALVSMQQFSGINVILFYTQTIFGATGTLMEPAHSTIIIGLVQFSSSFITPLFVDKMGKRFLLIFSAIGMGFSEAILGYYFHLKNQNTNLEAVFWLPIACLVIYNITYCAGFGPLPWAVMGEVFPGNIKSVASTVTAALCWFLGFVITKFFSNVTDVIGIAFSFWIFSTCCGLSAIFVYFYVPETSGKSLQEIQDILSGKRNEAKA